VTGFFLCQVLMKRASPLHLAKNNVNPVISCNLQEYGLNRDPAFLFHKLTDLELRCICTRLSYCIDVGIFHSLTLFLSTVCTNELNEICHESVKSKLTCFHAMHFSIIWMRVLMNTSFCQMSHLLSCIHC
jgi:hypothetical protein